MNGQKAKQLRQLVLMKADGISKIEAKYTYKEVSKTVINGLDKEGNKQFLTSKTFVATLAPCTRLAYKSLKKAYKQAA